MASPSPAWYKDKVYPENKVPALEHNGNIIGESLDLIKYLDNTFKSSSSPIKWRLCLRPYPSPGAVLRRNAETASSQKKKPNSHFTEITKRGDGKDGLRDAD
uniref:GST N-terminal domain-containing protein n=1 Tax=Brassica campestris TaxID=3711 RepID=M4F3X5_BRACM